MTFYVIEDASGREIGQYPTRGEAARAYFEHDKRDVFIEEDKTQKHKGITCWTISWRCMATGKKYSVWAVGDTEDKAWECVYDRGFNDNLTIIPKDFKR